MPHYLCVTCGTQFAETTEPPTECPICIDDRQYIGWQGQHWTTLEQLRTDHRTIFKTEEPRLTGIGMEPAFAINQRTQVVQTPSGNVLWESTSLIDDATIAQVNALGGLTAIAISHPHFYSAMVEWSRAFEVPIYLHVADRQWVLRPDPAIVFWEGDRHSLNLDLTLIRCGGHFSGSTALHWRGGAEGRGVLLAGDTIYVAADRRWVSFMHSFPNLLPLPASAVNQIVAAVEPFAFDRIYSAWFDRVLMTDAKAALRRSADRYIRAITDS